MAADLGLIAEPGVAVAAGVCIERIKLRGGDVCAGRGFQQRKRPQILPDDVAVGCRLRHRHLGALPAGVADVVGGTVGGRTLSQIREGGFPVDRLVI